MSTDQQEASHEPTEHHVNNGTGPRPLATRANYDSYSRNSRPNFVRNGHASSSGGPFALRKPSPRARHHIPEAAERCGRLYVELLADQEFLLQMQSMWQAKLLQLQMDQEALQMMLEIPDHEMEDLQPATLSVPSIEPQTNSNNNNNVNNVTQHSNYALYQKIEEQHQHHQQEDNDFEEEEDDDEDDETARCALTLMLAELGDQL